MLYGFRMAAPDRGLARRARVVAGFFALVCFGGLAARLACLQLFGQAGALAGRAAGQQLRDTVLPAARGRILDANGEPLAVSVTCWTIRASPREMDGEDVEPASRALAPLLGLSYEELYEILSRRQSNDALLLRRADGATARAVRDACAENGWQGILILEDTKRVYPQGDFAASLLGFTNVDNTGVAGLELEYNSVLTGQDGRVLAAKNAWGYDLPGGYATLTPAVEGGTLQLTIDANVQHYLENWLDYAVRAYKVTERGVGIVMEVDTGRVLAISTKPDYDPNQPRRVADDAVRAQVDSLTGEARAAALQAAQQAQWRNKAVSDLYEPGSVFKLITCAAALDSGAVTAADTFTCGQSYKVAGIPFHCANHKAHGVQSVAQALANSCNQSFIQIGQRLGKEKFCEYFAAFGLEGATGIDLPAEPQRAQFYTADRMGPVELASCSFGQSSKITPVQMLTAVCAIANGGELMEPYLVEKILTPQGEVAAQRQPTVRRRVISEAVSAQLCGMMEGVVNGGSGKNAYVAGYRVGGKTGTSQKLDSADETARIASFVGIAPADDPKIAVLIALDCPHTFSSGGGALAAPIAAKVLEQTLDYYGVQPRYTPEEQQRLENELPDMTGLPPEAAGARAAQAGFGVKTVGEGERVESQYPAAGQALPRGSTVLLYLSEQARRQVTVVPAAAGTTLAEATEAFHAAGLNLKAGGAPDAEGAVAVAQSVPAGESLPQGSLVTVTFLDPDVPADEDVKMG